ncbi:hypothetical protein [Actinoallomurus sp. CA-150999]|uniref:hypothetical protein n=1 Tax=Actinoallomurus sp. CA-150999 TaxID=3239887 RepID=UPI003D8E9B77
MKSGDAGAGEPAGAVDASAGEPPGPVEVNGDSAPSSEAPSEATSVETGQVSEPSAGSRTVRSAIIERRGALTALASTVTGGCIGTDAPVRTDT